MSAFSNEVVVSNFPADNALTDAQLRATAVPVSVPGSVAVTGPLTDAQLRATPVPVSGTVATGGLTDTQLRATPVPVSGSVTTTPVVAASSTVVQITSNGANQTLLAANANRKKALLFFNSGTWHVKLGATASATSYTLDVSASNYFLEIPTYTGIIDAMCTTSNKLVNVTELI